MVTVHKNRRTPPEKIRRIFLVEDHPIVSLGLRQLIRRARDLQVSGEARDCADALAKLASDVPDIVLLDFDLKNGYGFEIIKSLRHRLPALPILVVSVHDETLFADRILRAGAQGYIMKKSSTDQILEAIHKVLAGGIHLSEIQVARFLKERYEHLGPERSLKPLSERELEVFQLLGRGMTARQIADRLHLSVKTAETHRDHIRQKLGLRDAAELMQMAAHVACSLPMKKRTKSAAP